MTKAPFFKLGSPKTRVNRAMTIAMSNALGRLDKRAPALDYKYKIEIKINDLETYYNYKLSIIRALSLGTPLITKCYNVMPLIIY